MKICLDGKEGLFNQIEVGGIRGKEDQFALGLVFNEGTNLFRVVNIAVVEYEHTLWPWVGVSEGNDKILKELKEALCSD